jgi:hypothetical protein
MSLPGGVIKDRILENQAYKDVFLGDNKVLESPVRQELKGKEFKVTQRMKQNSKTL